MTKDLWGEFRKEYPNGVPHCPECGEIMYVSDPPHSIYCNNPDCGNAPDYVCERASEEEMYRSFRLHWDSE